MNYHKQFGPLHLGVDYYVELLGVLYILCEDQDAVCEAGVPQCNEEYVAEVKAFFQHTDHIQLTRTLELFSDTYWFNYDAPVQLMLMLSNNQPIDKDALFLERKTIPDALFEKFLADLDKFEQTSNFQQFYVQHIPMYETIAARFARDYATYNSHEFLLSRLNIQPTQEYHINFMVGITNANYGAAVGNKVYCNICPYHETRYAPMPDYSYSPIYYSTLVLHEFAHSFVNKAVAQYRNQIQAIDVHRYTQDLDCTSYGDSVETLINETIIRGLECIYVKMEFPDYYERYVDFNVQEGFSKLREVIALLTSPINYSSIINIFA